ncbi:MAG: hypothetical protein ACRD9S_17975 [Pyrinomonadaceae bacterium]
MVRKAARVNQGDLFVNRARVHGPSPEELEQTGVRASVVAMKLRNGSGAKGAQGGGYVQRRTMVAKPVRVPDWAKQAGQLVVNPSLWATRLLMLIEVHGMLSLFCVYAHQSLQR